MTAQAINFGDARLPERFWDKVAPCPMSGCWLWTAADNGVGYGVFTRDGVNFGAHRYAYVALVGDIENGLDCTAINSQRGKNTSHCKHGHEYTADNTYTSMLRGRPERGCRTCRNDASVRFRDRRKTHRRKR